MGPRVIIQMLTILLLVCSCGRHRPTSYLRFNTQSQQYYSNIAAACDSLIADVKKRGGRQLVIPWDDPRVPTVLQDLKPEYLDIDAGRAYIMVGRGRSSYAIIWQQANASQWKLSTVVDNLQKDLYTRDQAAFGIAPGVP